MRARTLWNNNGKVHLKKPFFQPLYICKQWIYLPLYAFTSRKNLLSNTYFLCSIRSMFPLLKSRLQIINLKSSNNQTIKHISYKTNNELISPRNNLINSTLNISFSNIPFYIQFQLKPLNFHIVFLFNDSYKQCTHFKLINHNWVLLKISNLWPRRVSKPKSILTQP